MRVVLAVGVLVVVAAAPVAAQISLDHLDSENPGFGGEGPRLEIEIAALLVLREATLLNGLDDYFESIRPKYSGMFTAVHEALYTLGLNPHRYNLSYIPSEQLLVCSEASVLSEQHCTHWSVGQVTDIADFLHDRNDGEMPPAGHIQLYVVLLEDEVAWRGKVGTATWRWWGRRADHHWSTTSCRAWSLLSVPILAHELGHCFHLQHNEDDSDYGLDLMVSYYTHYSWVKESNRNKVLHHFRWLPPEQSVFRTQPQNEFAF